MVKLASGSDPLTLAAMTCPIPQAVEMIGDKWTFLILREALLGGRHFEEFQSALGIARNILSNRLSKLVESGILTRAPDPNDGRRVVYALTAKGKDLLPVMVALRQWGEDWGCPRAGSIIADARDRRPIRRLRIEAEDGRPLGIDDLVWVPVPGRATKGDEAA